MFDGLLDLLAPEPCLACEREVPVGPLGLCVGCESAVSHAARSVRMPDPVTAGWALGPYEGAMGALVRCAKYRPRPALLAALGRRLGEGIEASDGTRVTWVPSPWRRRVLRGFDPAEIVARSVAAQLQLPIEPTLRRTNASPQAARSDRERRIAIRGAYSLRRAGPLLPGQRYLLVDDVVTTGATLATCADLLVCAGAIRVDGATVAARDL